MPKASAYLDSCVWIAQYKPSELTKDQRSGLVSLMESVNGGSVVIVASSMIFVEALTVSQDDIERAFDGRKGQIIAADEEIAKQSRILQNKCFKEAKKVLSPIDSIHLVTAAMAGCQQFVTLDRRHKANQLSPIADKVMLERLLGVKIVDPSELDDQKRLDLDLEEG